MADAQAPVRGHVTIEKHGKSLKLQQLLSILTLVLGIILVVVGSQQIGQDGAIAASTVNGVLTTFGGVVWLVVVKILMWWHHG